MASEKSRFATTGRSRKGEPWVWLTGAGLSVGVLLTLSLLTLVVVKGMETFWPNRLVELEVVQEGEAETMAGYIVDERRQRNLGGQWEEEIQIFRGNSGLHAEEFLFLNRENIESQTQPEDLLLVERLEGGNVIGRADYLELESGERIDAGEEGFLSNLRERIERKTELRERVEEIEKEEIGRNSARLKELRRIRDHEGGGAEVEAEMAQLQEEFEQLDARRKELREGLDASEFVVRAAGGGEISLTTGEMLHVFEPNRAGFFSRLGECLRRIWAFLSTNPREANTEGGVYPAIFGTVVMTLAMSLFVTPFGVIAAIYLREYARQGFLVRAVRISVNNLAGVPSIVFGVFGLAFFVYFVGGWVDGWFFPNHSEPVYKSGGILWASLTLALLTVPVVIVATEEALASVPRGVREAALASGASKWQTIQRVVLPASLPGILTGVILAMARGAGEVAPLMLVGVVKIAPDLPIDGTFPYIHPERQFMHLGFHIYDLGFQSPDSEAAKPMVFATTLLLITIVVVMNLTAIVIRNRIRRKYATSSF